MSQSMNENQTCKGMKSLRKGMKVSVYDNVATHPSRFSLRSAKAVTKLECNILIVAMRKGIFFLS